MALPRKLTAKIHEIKAHVGKVTSLDLGETGRVLVTGGQDRNVNLWAIGEEKCFMSLTGHNGTIDCVKFAYNDDFVYSADDIGIIRRWDLNAQTICSTLNGHMKSVRTLDFNPSGEYVVSGSNDTTVRLWDVRNHNKCIKTYRGHIANVNSVKFSPDGLWIASAGTEGSVIIWDIRKSKQIIQFTERASPITCIQFHPFEFLLAVGRNDGSVYIYDLESNQLISKTDSTCNFNGHTVKCITFSDNGECLFVGTAQGISVIGWEPDREFDNIESTWSILGDMKIVNKKLICGSYEREYVSIHALSIDRVFPFYNSSNAPFSHNQTTRKSFSRGNQKLRLSIGGAKPSRVIEESDEKSPSLDGQSSPNLSIELVEENDPNIALPNGLPVDNFNTKKISSYNFPSISSNTSYASSSSGIEGPSSLKLPGERDIYKFNRTVESYTSEIEGYVLNDSNPPIISNYIEPESEDFHVNNAQPPDYAPKLDTISFNNHSSNFKTPKLKSNVQVQKKTIVTKTTGFQNRKLSQVTSISTNDLHKLDETLVPTVTKKFNANNNRLKRDNNNVNKENNKNKNIPVQIMTKPTRSRTSFDLRSSEKKTITSSQQTHQHITTVNNESYQQMTKNIKSDLITPSHKTLNHNNFDETSDIQMLTTYHQQVYQELSNRHATLQLIRNSTKSQDIVGALNQAIKIKSRTVFVDILGATLEKTSTWNLDLCLILLPEIFELLQSQHKFHYTRACDTLRVILSNFLPIIQENIDPWSACSLGVDVTREERQHKCIECQHWLIKIRNITDSQHVGSALTQLQNLIVNI